MRSLFIFTSLLALAVSVAGCAKSSPASKPSATKQKPAAGHTTNKITAPVEHKATKPAEEHKATQLSEPSTAKEEKEKPPETKKPESEATRGTEVEAPMSPESPEEKEQQ